ncbi:DUF1178 family protein [Sphingorhabdus sp. IMCC26285]|uniref:DUF1178 family protein n=1 Tax=Sphingorhabdus profundilacus TaxID=2509718 RepID=A0A6I4LZG9_9SPHN|nr:DUF1178 family protein [Sphingorhabdus profundilacus]MVZ97483.1 DUF1178 family protein [Sphingorhabdus profundilacus]
MIAFDLRCSGGHNFEGWFASSSDFDVQQTGGLIACPVCDDAVVHKALSIPNVGRKTNQILTTVKPAPAPAPVEVSIGEVMNAPTLPPAMVEMMHRLATAQSEMLKESQWVGGAFAQTARAIHYGEESDRLIHGETSMDEAASLAEEGIAIAPLPFPVIPPSAKN